MPRPIHMLLLISVVFLLAAALASTVIATTRSGVITAAPGIPAAVIAGLVKASGQSLAYIDNWQVVAYTICAWLCWLFLSISSVPSPPSSCWSAP